MTTTPIKQYLKELQKAYAAGNATEHTHRPALKAFIESLNPGITATNEPKRIACGAPDFAVTDNKGPITLGHIEAKDIGKSLDEAEKTKQIKDYRNSLDNLILTDYLEFRWYVNGEPEPRRSARIARIGKSNKLISTKESEQETSEFLNDFLSHQPKPISSPKELAEKMARLTHLIRDIIIQALNTGQASDMLLDLRTAFAKTLIPDLDQPEKVDEFADMYAQTVAYGLFAARCNHTGGKQFRRLGAADEIPKTNPFLRKLFGAITGTDFKEEPYAGFVDDLVQVLALADIDTILAKFGKRTKQEDPIVHFYETFLASYDPALREVRGVYYTPPPVVSYIVRSIDKILRDQFALSQGFADTSTVKVKVRKEKNKGSGDKTFPRVLILDPACGTGTFLYLVLDHIRQKFIDQDNAGMWSDYVKIQLIQRMFGFELLMAPYAVAHLKMAMQLAAHDLDKSQRKKWACDLSGNGRLGVYLTNTLEDIDRQLKIPLYGPLRVISEEGKAADEIKHQYPIMAILGNPPYSGHSANRSWEIKKGKKVLTFIGQILRDYYFVDGKPLGERTSKWLQDDYVKFIRWAQWRIDKTGAGVLGFITNHGYLDNPTFRGMRQSLMKSFTDIYILDLHGNSKKKERCPDGSKDQNVFDIQQGVAIGIFVKRGDKKGTAKVYHADLWGLRDHKYGQLFKQDIGKTKWQEIKPSSPLYLFTPQDPKLGAEYQRGWKITDIFPINGVGLTTARDHVVIGYEQKPLIQHAQLFRDSTASDEELCRQLSIPMKKGWNIPRARKLIHDEANLKKHIKPILYRPFDQRLIFYHDSLVWRTAKAVMFHMLTGENPALITARSNKSLDMNHFFCTNRIMETKCGESTTQSCLFPLYLYKDKEKDQATLLDTQIWPADKNGRTPNLNPKFVEDLETHLKMKFVSDCPGDLKKTFGPEDILHYTYSIFYSQTYRDRYVQFLKRDFPRVPLTLNPALFRKLSVLGKELVSLHLLTSPAVSKPITKYPATGSHEIEKGYPKYLAPGGPDPDTKKPLKQGRVYINKKQYFKGITPEVWEFGVGGYRPCEKWLKDRKGRELSYEERMHYQKMVVALSQTIKLMTKINQTIPTWPIK